MLRLDEPLVIADLAEQARRLVGTAAWQQFRPGVAAHWLYDEGAGGPSAVLLKYDAGARVAAHEHVGYEHVLILDGDEYDEHGSYPAGSFVVNPPGSTHSPGSVGGCVALLIYEKAVRFLDDE